MWETRQESWLKACNDQICMYVCLLSIPTYSSCCNKQNTTSKCNYEKLFNFVICWNKTNDFKQHQLIIFFFFLLCTSILNNSSSWFPSQHNENYSWSYWIVNNCWITLYFKHFLLFLCFYFFCVFFLWRFLNKLKK